MSTNPHTLNAAREFVYSRECNLETKEPLLLDARKTEWAETFEHHPYYHLLKQSKGSGAVLGFLERSPLSHDERLSVLSMAASKVLLEAKGRINVLLDSGEPRAEFYRRDLSAILANEKITHVNNVERKSLCEIYLLDKSEGKCVSHKAILESLRQEVLVRPRMQVYTPANPSETPDPLSLLEREIESIVGSKIRVLSGQIKVAGEDLKRAVLLNEAANLEEKALGLKRFLEVLTPKNRIEKKARIKLLSEKREALEGLLHAAGREEKALLSGLYAPKIERALSKLGINSARLFGPDEKDIQREVIQKAITKEKLLPGEGKRSLNTQRKNRFTRSF